MAKSANTTHHGIGIYIPLAIETLKKSLPDHTLTPPTLYRSFVPLALVNQLLTTCFTTPTVTNAGK